MDTLAGLGKGNRIVRLYREVRALTSYESTSEIQRQTNASNCWERAGSALAGPCLPLGADFVVFSDRWVCEDSAELGQLLPEVATAFAGQHIGFRIP